MQTENLWDMQSPSDAECLVHNLLCPGQVSVMYGPPNTGKTFIALELARCIATETRFLGQPTMYGGVYIAELEGRYGMNKRASAIKQYFADEAEKHPIYIGYDQLDLNSPDVIKKLKSQFQSLSFQPILLIIDTLSMAMNGADENASAMTAAALRLKEIAAHFSCHVMVIHHSGKDPGRGARGHSSLKGIVDTEMLVSDNKIKVTKQRDLPKIDSLTFRLEVVDLEVPKGSEPTSSCVVVQDNRTNDQELLLDILEASGASAELIDIRNIRENWVFFKRNIKRDSALKQLKRVVDSLVEQGLLRVHGDHFILTNQESANDDDFSGTNSKEQSHIQLVSPLSDSIQFR